MLWLPSPRRSRVPSGALLVMVLHGLQSLVAILSSGLASRLLLRKHDLPPPRVLTGGLGAAYFDASSRSFPLGLDAYLVKLAVLARIHSRRGGVEERVYHPVPVTGQGVLPPLFLGRGGERVRQAAVYIVELAAMLAAILEPSMVFWEKPSRILLVRHGPLLQMISHYVSKPYHVGEDEARRLLGYAGLEKSVIDELVEGARSCSSGGRVVLGLLALIILSRLVGEARRRGIGVAGMVEDVSRSHMLHAAMLARVIADLAARSGGAATLASMAGRAVERCRDYYNAPGNRRALDDCLCPTTSPSQLLGSRSEWDSLLAGLESVLQQRFRVGLRDAGIEEIEASLGWGGPLPSVSDPELLYTLYYLYDGDRYPATAPLAHAARLKILSYYLSTASPLSCHRGSEALHEALRALRTIRYQYIAPVEPPTCKELFSLAARLPGIRPCTLAGLQVVPPAIRLEYVEGTGLEEEARALALYPARILLYGYPSQLLVVDAYSRISPAELAGFREVAERLVERMQPYTVFIRGWEARVQAIA